MRLAECLSCAFDIPKRTRPRPRPTPRKDFRIRQHRRSDSTLLRLAIVRNEVKEKGANESCGGEEVGGRGVEWKRLMEGGARLVCTIPPVTCVRRVLFDQCLASQRGNRISFSQLLLAPFLPPPPPTPSRRQQRRPRRRISYFFRATRRGRKVLQKGGIYLFQLLNSRGLICFVTIYH